MAPRLQCLNAVRELKHAQSFLRAFSTSQKACVDAIPNESAALLNSLFQTSKPTPNASESPIRLAGRPVTRTVFRDERSRPENGQGATGPSRLIERTMNRLRSPTGRQPGTMSANSAADYEKAKAGNELSKMISRRWKVGDVYAPHDLSSVEMQKWKQSRTPDYDVFDVLAMNPIDEYKNFSIMSEYMSPMGRIKHSSQTGLRPVNQRRISKAIRRSIGLGIMPSVYRHPEILQKEVQRQNDQQSRARLSGR